MTRLPVVLAAAAMLPATAHAWKHSDPYFAWLPEDMPIPYVTQAECEDSVPQEYCDEMIAQVYDVWRSVPCVDYDFVYDSEAEAAPENSHGRIKYKLRSLHVHDLVGAGIGTVDDGQGHVRVELADAWLQLIDRAIKDLGGHRAHGPNCKSYARLL